MAATDPKKENVYNTRTLSKWFAISSIVLLVIVVAAVIQDYDREWKTYARQQHKIIAAMADAKLKGAESRLPKEQLEKIKNEIAELTKRQTPIAADLEKRIAATGDVYYKANQEYQAAKAQLDADLFVLDHAVAHASSSAGKLRKAYDIFSSQVARMRDKANLAERARDAAVNDKRDFLRKQKELSDKIQALTADQSRLEKIIAKNEVSLGYIVRNAPVVDFVSPTLKINQIVLAHLKDDYFFNQVPRVDRCMTCHANADKAGFENLPQPFKTHPKLKLYLHADSKHPVEKVGCTVCHGGIPQSVDFSLAGHVPKDAIQEQEWESKYNFKAPRHITSPMIPTAMTEGKCIQCHAKNVQLADAPTYNAGMRLVERYGCYGCHKFEGHFGKLAKEKKVGPSLQMAASKMTPEFMTKFIADPQGYRPSSLMPRFWKNHNNSDPASLERGKVEVDAIVSVLVKKSAPYTPLKLASNVSGNGARGKDLVGKVGCLACHAVADFPRTNVAPTELGHNDPRVPLPGPELNQLGSKVSKDWLHSWLINPKHYWEGTVMPSLRLNDQEVADITAYLLEKRNTDFEEKQIAQPSNEVRDQVVVQYLSSSMTDSEAKIKLSSMSLEDKKLFLGDKLISHYGCYGCHAIEGYENAPYVGAELTLEGSKDLSKFSFENLHSLPHYRHEWIYTKVRTPRVWDIGKTKDFEAKAKMPYFGFSHDQATAITAIVIGNELKKVDDEALFKIDGRWEDIIAGERQANRLNCVACHSIENMNGQVVGAHYQDDSTMGPPNLNTQGAKTQTDWLYRFLLNPNVKIRPWLDIRMPQFNMAAHESVVFTKYFASFDKAEYPYVTSPLAPLSNEEIKVAQTLIEKQGCMTCHAARKPGEDVSAAAPLFPNIKKRLKSNWLASWLRDPQAIMPGTRMPTLWPSSDDNDPKAPLVGVDGIYDGNAEKQIDIVARYLAQYPGEAEVPSERSSGKRTGEARAEMSPTDSAKKPSSPNK